MPDDKIKMFSQKRTGAVPKIKHPNNTLNTSSANQNDFQRNLSNNLLPPLDIPYKVLFLKRFDWQGRDSANSPRNSERNLFHINPYSMEASFSEDYRPDNLPGTVNGALSTSSTGASNSRRDSVGTIPKCDNVKKCPDKKQIEEKLNQIREYIQVTNSLMSGIKTDDQLVENGMDTISEPSTSSGYQRNELEEKVEFTNRKVLLLREQQNALINLKRKAENQLRDARLAQENLLLFQEHQQPQQQKYPKQLGNTKLDFISPGGESCTEESIFVTKSDSRNQDTTQPESDFFNESFDNRNQLSHFLGNRDVQLNSEHLELQEKLTELHCKKMQIDHLAQQLQHLGDEDDEDIGNQVRKIVTMKQQLSSLKDLLEIVKTAENSLQDSQNVNTLELESSDNNHIKTDNIRQDIRLNCNPNENVRVSDQFGKQSNKKSMINVQQREKALSELKAKKRELEEIMYKQKDSTSINNDVCSETSVNKSDLASNNMFNSSVMSWLPVHPHQQNQVISNYSSDDCPEEDINEYSDLNSSADVTIGTIPPPQAVFGSNYSTPVMATRYILDQRSNREFVPQPSPRSAEQCGSTNLPSYEHERSLPNNNANESDNNKIQLQKQLELIQCVCQSLLEQQTSNNIQQLQNNLTPSPIYTEPRSYMSTNPCQSNINMSYLNNPHPINPSCLGLGEVATNQNMLAANTLQTQAFLLNTLNQCCQMLWFQQREIASLRSMVCGIQDQMTKRQPEQDLNSIQPPSTSYVFPTRPISSLSNFRAPSQPRTVNNSKVNQVSAACSLPNLNPSNSHTNIDNAYSSQNNMHISPSARLLETSLNNIHHNFGAEQPANNTVLPNVNINSNISQSLPSQVWNGQALNNQVAPGNRANNYWDNFRSYSRQNLLSTSSKSNEVLQTGLERSNTTCDRSQSASLHQFCAPKLNTVHNDSTNLMEGSSQTHFQFKPSQNSISSNKSTSFIPPDVLNINHNLTNKTNPQCEQSNEVSSGFNIPENDFSEEIDEDNSTFVKKMKDWFLGRNLNECNDNDRVDNLPRSKLFEELRDNVYGEVANLISANENRPHFLIQLFRDLQLINSDSMRGQTLQSIQSVISNSENTRWRGRGANRHFRHVDQFVQPPFSGSYAIWPIPPRADPDDRDDPDLRNVLNLIASFLNSHYNDIMNRELRNSLKDLIIKATPFMKMVENTAIQEHAFQKHFSSVVNDALLEYQGQKISDINKQLYTSLTNVLVGEFSVMSFIRQEAIVDHEYIERFSAKNENSQSQQVKTADDGSTPQMQNGDLAEADQSCVEIQEEEGAVGGLLNVIQEVISTTPDPMNSDSVNVQHDDLPTNTESEVEFTEQGLDEVPTRLMTINQPHSITPIEDYWLDPV